METTIIIVSSLVLIALSAVCLCAATSFWHRLKKMSIGLPTTPPGAKGLPFIGESLDFFRCNLRGNPESFILSRMRKFSTTKIFTTSLLGEDVVVFCGASGNRFFHMAPNECMSTWLPSTLKNLLLSPENNKPTSVYMKDGRRIATGFLKPEFLRKEIVGVMDCMSKQHFEKLWAPERQVHVFELVQSYTFGIACRFFLSLEDPEKASTLMRLFKSITAGILTMPLNFPGTPFYRAVKSSYAIRNELGSIIKKRKLDIIMMMPQDKISDIRSSSKDMVSHMLLSAYALAGKFPSDVVVVDHILGFLFADHDSSSSIITCMVKYLAELPELYAQVLEEQMEILQNKKEGELLNWGDLQKMKYTWNVACETMRLAPPAPGTFREVMADFTYAGFTIPKGWKAYWTVHSTYKNPDYFKNPDKFDPTRFEGNGPLPYSFLPFGGGYHACPAREYAKIKILVFIHNLVTQYDFENVLPGEKIIFPTSAIPANGLPMRIRRRNADNNLTRL